MRRLLALAVFVIPLKTANAALAVARPTVTALGLESVEGKSGEQIENNLSILAEVESLVAEDKPELYAANGKRPKLKSTKNSLNRKTVPRAVAPVVSAVKREEDRARQAVRRGDYSEASRIFYGLLDKEMSPERLTQIRFILGRTLQELKLNQVATFPYYEIIRSEGKRNPKNKYVRQSLERIATAADALESDVLLNYALKQLDETDVPAANRDMLFYRRGELQFREGKFIEAAKEFNRVRSGSVFSPRARYRLGLALVEGNQLEKAEEIFTSIANVVTEQKADAGITNKIRVNALLGKARTLYQRKMFTEATDAYREIPRDTEQWHDALFESTWAHLQDGRFRSALSNFHSLHSPFYEEFYQPESLLLRSIVYHYICRYDEMDKTLGLFERIYTPVQRDLRSTLLASASPTSIYRELRKVDESLDDLKKKPRRQNVLPFLVARQVLREGDVRRSLQYIRNLESEKKRIDHAPPVWRDSKLGRYAKKVVEKRIEATQAATGRVIQKHLGRIQADLAGHIEQAGLIRLDMMSGKKEAVKKEIAGKGLIREKVDESQDRSFYIQNGYDYWPFKGEFWLDEIGNYHYVGVKACE